MATPAGGAHVLQPAAADGDEDADDDDGDGDGGWQSGGALPPVASHETRASSIPLLPPTSSLLHLREHPTCHLHTHCHHPHQQPPASLERDDDATSLWRRILKGTCHLRRAWTPPAIACPLFTFDLTEHRQAGAVIGKPRGRCQSVA